MQVDISTPPVRASALRLFCSVLSLVQLAYALRRGVLGSLRVRTRGVKVLLLNDAGEVLLIRNSYGNRNLFVLPGGGIGWHETPETAAAREVREELGVELRELTLIATYQSGAEGKRDTVHLFRGKADGEIAPDPVELEEARFFAMDALPEQTSPATLRRLSEIRGERQMDGCW